MRLDFFSGRARQCPSSHPLTDTRFSRLCRPACQRPGLTWHFNSVTRRPESRWTLDNDKPPSAHTSPRARPCVH